MYRQLENQIKGLTFKKVSAKVRALFTEKELAKIEPYAIENFSREFWAIYQAIVKGWKVWAVCDKEPRGNLDTGKHYFSIHYLGIGKEGPTETRLWAYNDIIAKKFYFDINNRHTYLDKYIFSSGAIGMSRQLDATNGFFEMMRRLTGVYCQL